MAATPMPMASQLKRVIELKRPFSVPRSMNLKAMKRSALNGNPNPLAKRSLGDRLAPREAEEVPPENPLEWAVWVQSRVGKNPQRFEEVPEAIHNHSEENRDSPVPAPERFLAVES